MSLGTKIKRRFCAALFLTALLLSGASPHAQTPPPAAESVAVRVGDHGNMVRVVIDCARLTAYKVEKNGDALKVRLDSKAPGKVLPWKNQILKKLAAMNGGDGALSVDVGIPAGATYRDYRVDNKIVLDIAAPGTPKPAPPAAAPAVVAKKPPAKAVAAPIAITPPSSVPPAEEKEEASAKAEAPAEKVEKPKAEGPPVAAVKVQPVETGPVMTDPEAIAGARLPGPAPAAQPSWNLSITRPDGGSMVEAALHGSADTDAPAGPVDNYPSATLSVSSLTPQKIAVFERLGVLWIVTDAVGAEAGTPPQVTGPLVSFITSPRVLRFKEGTAYRYTLSRKFYPTVTKRNLSWDINLSLQPPPVSSRRLAAPVKVELDKTTHQPYLVVNLKGAGMPITFEDPEIGDTLVVVPSAAADEAVTEERKMMDAEMLPAFGLAVRPIKDGVSVRRVQLAGAAPAAEKKDEHAEEKPAEGEHAASGEDHAAESHETPPPADGENSFVVITAPSGLNVTQEGQGAIELIGAADDASNDDGSRLFDFPNWQQGGLRKFQQSRAGIQEMIAAAATPEERAGGIMTLAKFYFANNFGQETLGALSLAESENPDIVKNPDFMAIRGAANAMSGRYKEALDDLSFPAIQGHPEVNLWVGYAAAATEQWRMATRSFPDSNRLLMQYPDSLAIPFTVYMAESQLHLGHTDMALKLLGSVNTNSEMFDPQYKAAIDYLRGIAFAQRGENDKAADLWGPVANGLDRLYHAKASLSLTRLLLQQQKITLKEAIDKVDSLRFAWRGNGLEVTILHTLGALKVQDGQILSGLEDMNQAASLSDSLLEDSTPIRDDMRRIFTDVFLTDAGAKVQPLELVSVYNEFNNLVPPGDEANAVALSFANSLIRMDLLDKAAAQMESQLKNSMPQDRADALGTKLTAVYLLDKKPEEALAALQETERAGFGPKMQEERTLLKARALSQMNKAEEAAALLTALNSKNAQKLKADLLWRAQKWAEAAAAIDTFLPDPSKPLDDEGASYVVNSAVAWKISGNTEKLKEIREKYTTAMAATKQAATFGVVTRDGGASSLADRETMMNIAGEVDMFKGFLDHYKAGTDSGT